MSHFDSYLSFTSLRPHLDITILRKSKAKIIKNLLQQLLPTVPNSQADPKP